MNLRKMSLLKVILKKINKECFKFNSSILSINFYNEKSKFGIIYTMYSDKLNIIQVGFAENDRILETRLAEKNSILLGKKKGEKKELNLLIKTLNEMGIKFYGQFDFSYTKKLIRHLSILGWPIGKSFYKKRVIRKELSFT